MCIFSKEIDSLKKTRIFASLIKQQDRQLIVYSNEVDFNDTDGDTYMILPVPNDPGLENGGIQLHDFTSYRHIFNDLDSFFPEINKPKARQNNNGHAPYDITIASDFNTLLKMTVGSADMKQIAILREMYQFQFGFIICRMKKGSQSYPIAFTSPFVNGKLFIPTRQWLGSDDKQPRWDHVVYVCDRKSPKIYHMGQHSGLDTEQCILPENTFELKARRLCNRLPVKIDEPRKIWRSRIRSIFHENPDIMCSILRTD